MRLSIIEKFRVRFLHILFIATMVPPAAAQGPYYGLGGNEIKERLTLAGTDTGKVNLLLALSSWHTLKRGELATDLDSATKTANSAMLLSKKCRYIEGEAGSYLALATVYREKGDMQQSTTFLDQCISIAKKNNLYEILGEASNLSALSHGIENEEMVGMRIKYFDTAANMFAKAGNVQRQARALQDLGENYLIISDYTNAVKALENSLKLYTSVGFKDQQGAYLLLGSVYNQTGQYDLALKYGFQAEQLAGEVGDTSLQICAIYNHIARTYSVMKSFDAAVVYYQKSLTVAMKYKDTISIETVTQNIVSSLVRNNEPGEALKLLLQTAKDYPAKSLQRDLNLTYMFTTIYTMLGEYEKAAFYYNKLSVFHKKLEKDDPGQHLVYKASISYLQAMGQYASTYEYLDEYTAFCRKKGNLLHISACELLYFKTDSAMGRLVPAIRHFQLYKSLNDSIFNIEKSKQINWMQLQFETAKKDKDIVILTKQGELTYSNLQKERIVRNMIIAGAALLLFLLILGYSRYQSKQRNARKLESKQREINHQNDTLKKLVTEKEWLLKEIHHRVKNNLQIVISLLNTQSAYLDNEEAKSAISNSQHRMHAMSLIHQKLYKSENLNSIDMAWYIHELVKYMRESLTNNNKIDFVLDVESVELDAAQAIPLGLILNEAISNAIKYAFPGDEVGIVFISFKKLEGKLLELVIKDHGIGLPKGFDIQESDSLGMSLIQGLTSQLDGTVELQQQNGLGIRITFLEQNELTEEKVIQ